MFDSRDSYLIIGEVRGAVRTPVDGKSYVSCVTTGLVVCSVRSRAETGDVTIRASAS